MTLNERRCSITFRPTEQEVESGSACLHDVSARDTIMIKNFRHKGLQRFFETGSLAGIQAAHATRLRLQLIALHNAKKPDDLAFPAWHLHLLKGGG